MAYECKPSGAVGNPIHRTSFLLSGAILPFDFPHCGDHESGECSRAVLRILASDGADSRSQQPPLPLLTEGRQPGEPTTRNKFFRNPLEGPPQVWIRWVEIPSEVMASLPSDVV